ncbi:carboxylesterase family protein [Streptomyces aurantiacus]|uniref:Carboxylic ester hydrolase n=1 Tax=Streptomyces aurantiacus JA 4570 TaxID=1286094 RepID=S3ZN67_9ACTN|nr:carboxylesterase family protein [Streptomyces aurantiacus]EPH44976.1 putative Carboxylesterase [Streptomyces aurantiacus JA 4570]
MNRTHPPVATGPVVTTANGPVRGFVRDGVAAFLNIPYAAPPRGAARFAAPEPHAPWTAVRDATTPGPTAPQGERRLGGLDMSPYFGPGWVRGDDYLTVDVRTPAADRGVAERPLPVMVFVHGGGFVAGSTRAALYDGSALARDGVVLVTLNYRLGFQGFLDLPGAPANRGLLDVRAALRWVRDEIAAFGGDPHAVTVFGQSAGATLVAALLADPEATGLFRRAVVQSGSGLGAFSPEQAARVTRAAAAALGVEARAGAFAAVPDERLVGITPSLTGLDLRTASHTDPLMGLSPLGPVLAEQPAHALAARPGTPDVDLLVGTTAQEGNLYLVPQGAYAASTAADVEATAARAHPRPAELVAAHRAARPGASFGALRSGILAEALFGAGSRALADAHAAKSPSRTHRYVFAWRSPALGGALGAAHTVELPFVFGRTDLPALYGTDGVLGPAAPPAAAARLAELSGRMRAAWVRFAATGDPGWEPYDDRRRATMRIDVAWTPADDPDAAERAAWGPGYV